MKHDTDVDVTTHLVFWNKLKNINFTKYDLIVSRIIEKYPNRIEGNMISIKSKFNNKFYCDIYTNPAFPLLTYKNLNGIRYPIPINSELYLSMLYGKNWMIPSKTHADTQYHRYSGLVNSEYNVNWDKKYGIYKGFSNF